MAFCRLKKAVFTRIKIDPTKSGNTLKSTRLPKLKGGIFSNLAVPKTKKIMNNQTIRKLTIMKNKVSRCSSSLTTQWNALPCGEYLGQNVLIKVS